MPDRMVQGAAAFASALRAILPPGVTLGQADPARLYPLAIGEGLPLAVPKRQAEFSAGRAAARAALRRPDQPLPVGPDRAPIWPAGRVGSITQCAGLCLAVVARSTDYRGLGLDAEPMEPMDPALWPQILHPDENVSDGLAALAHFVAKEAAYKAQFVLTKQLFGFQTLRLNITGDSFEAEFTEPVRPFDQGDRLPGTILRAGGFIGAMVALKPPLPGA